MSQQTTERSSDQQLGPDQQASRRWLQLLKVAHLLPEKQLLQSSLEGEKQVLHDEWHS